MIENQIITPPHHHNNNIRRQPSATDGGSSCYLSIVVAAYNVEKYISECISSLFVEQDGCDSFEYEVIVVNDGSTDSTPQIVQDLQKHYPALTLINQENRHVGGAKNTGVRQARGEYIYFVERVRKVLPKKLNKCRAIITCSESSKNDIIRYFDIDPGKIHVTYWGINHALFKPADDKAFLRKELTAKFGINKPYFFACSCNYKRKNTIELIKAYNLLSKQHPENDLVVVWNYYGKDIEELTRDNNRIHLIRRVSDEDLAKLYNGAIATYYPSKYEGFGLPILESMACGTPVVTANNSSLPEIGLDIASYLETNDVDGILSSMEKIENGNAFAPNSIDRGINHASTFTWKRCAEKTLDVYQKYI